MPKKKNRISRFFQEFERRKVWQILIAYAGVAAIIYTLIPVLEDDNLIPSWSSTLVLIVLIVGIPITGILAWIFNKRVKEQTEPELLPGDIKEKSIIVLPFENISSDPEQEYFSDGLTEEIITDLSYINDLLVISRSSAMTFKGTKKKIKEIASDVNVRYVLEGSVRKSGNDLRIVAQLIDSSNDSHIWAEKYNGKLDDIFGIQEKVSRSVADSLKLKLSAAEKGKISEQLINDPFAYELYLKARVDILKFSKDGLDNAHMYIQKGLDILGENVILLAGMGYISFQYINLGITNDDVSIKKVEEYAKKIFDIEPDSPYGHLILGLITIFWRSTKEGASHFQKVISKNPNDFDALLWFSGMLATIGKSEASLSPFNKLMEIDPLGEWGQIIPGFIDYWNGEFDKAIVIYNRVEVLFPESFFLLFIKALILVSSSEIEKSISILKDLSKAAPDTFSILLLKYVAAFEGNIEELKRTDSQEFQKWAWRDLQISYWMSQVYAIADDKTEALKWLEHAVDLGMFNYPFISELDPLLENIRGEEKFNNLIKRVKIEWENFEV